MLTLREVELYFPGSLAKFPYSHVWTRFYPENGVLFARTRLGKVFYWSAEDGAWFES